MKRKQAVARFYLRIITASACSLSLVWGILSGQISQRGFILTIVFLGLFALNAGGNDTHEVTE